MVSARDRNKQSLTAEEEEEEDEEGLIPPAGRQAGRAFLSSARLAGPPFHNKATASDCICPQSLIKIATDRQ